METAIEVRGKAYTLAVTVQAYAELSELCPGKDFSGSERLWGNLPETL